VNGIANRTLISDETNRKISDKAPAQYLVAPEVFSGAPEASTTWIVAAWAAISAAVSLSLWPRNSAAFTCLSTETRSIARVTSTHPYTVSGTTKGPLGEHPRTLAVIDVQRGLVPGLDIDPATDSLTVTLEESGTYEIYCPVDDHQQRGMIGTLEVEAMAP